MKSVSLGLCLLFLIVFLSCHSRHEEAGPDTVVEQSMQMISPLPSSPGSGALSEEEALEEEKTAPNAEPKGLPVNNKVIKDGSISIKTRDITASKSNIDKAVKSLAAYYEKEEFQNNDQTVSYDLKIRVSAISFEKLIAAIENGKDEIINKSFQARDVTEEYIDIETRLASKRAYLNRYKQLLSKATSVKDILAIEENINTLQEEIESREGRLKYLNDQISYSTLAIHLFTEKEFVYKPEQPDNFSERVKKSLSRGWTIVVELVLGAISIWPFMILLSVVVFLYRRWRRKNKKV